MRKIILDMQSRLYAKAIQRILVQELEDYQVIISEAPDKTAKLCKTFQPYALLMEVTGYTPWMLEERLNLRNEVLQKTPHCKIAVIVDENAEKELAHKALQAKKDGLIDQCIYGSVSDSYLSAIVDTL